MFAFLNGIVDKVTVDHVELDVHGVGYFVFTPQTVQNKLRAGERVKLLTYCYIREDTFSIYGFLHEEERALFSTLLNMSGIGPKLALAVLSAMTVQEFGRAVSENDLSALTRVNGIGKKNAQRIILEMKTRLGQNAELNTIFRDTSPPHDDKDDVVEALLSLGCTLTEARRAAQIARQQLGTEAREEDLIRAALRSLAKV